MEELKASADPAVMYGAHYFCNTLIPSGVMSRSLLNLIHRNSSVNLSNLQGPSMNLSICSHRLHKIFYWMSTPPSIAISFNVITYGHKLFVSISTTSILIPSAKILGKLFSDHIEILADLLSKRRVPGEARSKKRPHHVIIEAPVGSGRRVSGYGRTSPILNAPFTTSELTERLHHVQFELNQLNEALDSVDDTHMDRDTLTDRLEELKTEFSELMKQIRRRKSLAEFGPNIIISSTEVSIKILFVLSNLCVSSHVDTLFSAPDTRCDPSLSYQKEEKKREKSGSRLIKLLSLVKISLSLSFSFCSFLT